MTITEFAQLAQTWGGDIARWPADLRTDAEAFAVRPEAQPILAEARALDREIERLAPEIASARIETAIYGVINTIARPAQAREPSLIFWLRWLVPAAGFACAALIGILLAISHPVDLVRPPADPGMIFTLLLDSAAAEQDWMTQ